jgi:cytochrome c-type biogenesis protein CcmH/NrfG
MFGAAFATVLPWILIGLGTAVPVLFVFHAWLAEETLTTGPALGILAALFLAPFILWASVGTAGMLVWVVLTIAACAAIPLLSKQADRNLLTEMLEEKIARCQEAIRRDPANAAAYASLADACLESGRLEEAIQAYETAIRLDPDHMEAERAKLQKALASRPPQLIHTWERRPGGESADRL